MRYFASVLVLLAIATIADACPVGRARGRLVHRERHRVVERHGLFGFGVVGVRAAPCGAMGCPAAAAPAVVVPPKVPTPVPPKK